MKRGKVLWYNVDKGFGVIVDSDGISYFAHFTDINGNNKLSNFRKLDEETSVEFLPSEDNTRFNLPRAKKISEV